MILCYERDGLVGVKLSLQSLSQSSFVTVHSEMLANHVKRHVFKGVQISKWSMSKQHDFTRVLFL